MPSRIRYAVLVVVLLLAASGCGGQRLVKLEGTVTLDGQPLDGATVTFSPEGGSGNSASGLTGSDGVFYLTTRTSGDGVAPGSYKVTVTKAASSEVPGMQPPNPSDPQAMQKAMKAYYEKHKAPPDTGKKQALAIPAQYTNAEKSPLKCQVPPDGPVEFKLRSKGG
jgi:hypothetical protein